MNSELGGEGRGGEGRGEGSFQGGGGAARVHQQQQPAAMGRVHLPACMHADSH